MSRLPPRIFAQNNRRLLSLEKGTIKKSWEGKSSVVLAYPNRYFLGMSNLGFQSTYQLFNNLPNTVCERAFLPEQDEQHEFIRSQTPLCSFESLRPLGEFDIIAFSLSFENDYPAILSILKLAAIPFTSAERGNRYPLIIAGGICTFFNPEPLAEFIDLFVIGEAEEVLPKLIENYQNYHSTSGSREDLLTRLASEGGIYLPQLYEVTYNPSGTIKSFSPKGKAPPTIQRKYTRQLDRFPVCSVITTPETEFADMFLMEVTRGCTHRCNFCAIGCVYTPYRVRSLEKLKETATKGLGQKYKIGLIGATLADYPHINDLCKFIIEEGGKFSSTSMRVDLLDEELIKLMKHSGHQTITLAPETGSERLRRVLGKNLSNRQIYATVKTVAQH
ncbi:MAG: radical SAM protein, partial [Thermodesulfobacteriota bacterium]|nr:radical SAM protein [Thermodesulfobacteriota bacterium]